MLVPSILFRCEAGLHRILGHTAKEVFVKNQIIVIGAVIWLAGVFLLLVSQIPNERNNAVSLAIRELQQNDSVSTQETSLGDATITEADQATAPWIMESFAERSVRTGLDVASKKQQLGINLPALCQANPDTIGYIRIPDTKIDYPVLASQYDYDEYLHKDFFGEKSVYGSIYKENASNEKHLVLYGHHMKNGKMFGELKLFLDSGFAKSHSIYLATRNSEGAIEYARYEVCMVFTAAANDEALLRSLIPYSEEEGNLLLSYAAAKGTVLRDFFYQDETVALITCEYTEKDNRLIVIGRRVS